MQIEAMPTAAAGESHDDGPLSLCLLMDPEVLANPYPLYRRLRACDPVHWDPYIHAWVVTRYEDVVTVLTRFSAARTPGPEYFEALRTTEVTPVARVMVKQMLFMDAPAHTRLRRLAAPAFSPGGVRDLRTHIEEIAARLIDEIVARDSTGNGAPKQFDLLADFAEPLPAIVTTELLGVPVDDHSKLKEWSVTFAEMLGNFQHNPDRLGGVLRAVENLNVLFLRCYPPTAQKSAAWAAPCPDDGRDRRRPPERRGNLGQLHSDHGWRPGNDDQSDHERHSVAVAGARSHGRVAERSSVNACRRRRAVAP